ncbi:Acylpyruvase fahd1, mitochondrial [Nowakowskiella sp. JEL0078]|nr:Acylpyruvase fahd1, mitochondrial [Nowakowskiella sp. JEL0078]
MWSTMKVLELGVVIGRDGCDIKKESAKSYISGYVLALDMTDRTEQLAAKNAGQPWTVGKGFDTFTPISRFIHKDSITDPHKLELWLKNNGKIVQEGDTGDMIFDIPTIINYVSSIMKLEEGDLILTGTPKGVGPVKNGDVLTAGLRQRGSTADIVNMTFAVADREGNGLFAKL